ncbi:hypothetical protein NMY3_02372 [Candidatus Nitrosocosmicus oleophilus]|jgi:hypothetical protein|uniref:Uncharacterized protein n=1 Tax=Candidatus Nitrosocosmicus oleophilus TaxID=1353260 RepID=A0A654LYP3_9ARCH|nr:hypothetical protein NMY3_02372 [Candidatus Nitrosocosmicus oleophilus]
MTETCILLNVNCKNQQRIPEEEKKCSFVETAKSLESAMLSSTECK